MSSFKDINFGSECLQLDKFDLRNLVYDHNGDFFLPAVGNIIGSAEGPVLFARSFTRAMEGWLCDQWLQSVHCSYHQDSTH